MQEEPGWWVAIEVCQSSLEKEWIGRGVGPSEA